MEHQDGGQGSGAELPRWRDDLEAVCIGRMGSEFFRWRFAPDDLPAVLAHGWEQLGRRVFVDRERGEVTVLTPSASHEYTAVFVGHLVLGTANALSIPYAAGGSTIWWRPGGVVVQADQSFFLAEGAFGWREAVGNSQPEGVLEAIAAEHSPQLAVEVERACDDASKPEVYRDLGVTEMWRIDAPHPLTDPDRKDPALSVEILDLQNAGRVQAVDSSSVLPGLTPAVIAHVLEAVGRFGPEIIPDRLASAGIGRRPE